MTMDPLSDVLSAIKNHEKIRKREIIIKKTSKMIRDSLRVMKDEGFISDIDLVDEDNSREFIVRLNGKINDCGVIKPRFSVKHDAFEKWEKRYLPAVDFGILLVSTSDGIISHKEAQDRDIGGRLIAYVY